jgi:hypothetical protein
MRDFTNAKDAEGFVRIARKAINGEREIVLGPSIGEQRAMGIHFGAED